MIVAPPNGDDFEVDLGAYLLQNHASLSISDRLEFESSMPIAPRSSLSWTGKFHGPVVCRTGAADGLPSYIAISRLAQLQYRHTFPTAYGSGDPDTSSTHLLLSAVLSSDAPAQAAGSDQYVVGRIWGTNSLVWPDAGEWSAEGIWTCEDAGTLSRIGSAAIYYCGILCSEVEDPGDLSGGSFRVYRGEDVLMVRGAGSGDIYGPIHADNAFDTGLRLGDIETDDNIFVGIDIGVGTEWDLLAAIVRDMGMFISIRDGDTATYIDISDSAPGRGSFDEPFATLETADIVKWERMSYSGIPANVIIGLGRGEQYSKAGSIRGAMVAELVDTSESFKSPWGSLSALVDDRYAMSRSGAKLRIGTTLDYLKVGDWIKAEILPGEEPVGQILHIDEDESGIVRLVVGGNDGTFEDAALSPGAEAEYVRRLYGYSETEDTIKISQARAIYIGGSSGDYLYPRMAATDDGLLVVTSPTEKRLLVIDPVKGELVREATSDYFDVSGIAVQDGIIYTQEYSCPVANLLNVTPHSNLANQLYAPGMASNDDYVYALDQDGGRIYQYNRSDLSAVKNISAGWSNPNNICGDETNVFISAGYWAQGVRKYDTDLNLIIGDADVSIAGGDIGADSTYIYRDKFSGLDAKAYLYRHNRSDCEQVNSVQKASWPNGSGGVVADISDTYIYILKFTADDDHSFIYIVKKSDLSDYGVLGETTMPTAFEMEFTTKDFAGGAAKVLFSLECAESGAYSWGSIKGTFKIYVNDELAAVLRDRDVSGTPIDSLDVAPWLNLDGSTETIAVWAEWENPLEEISFKGYVEGTQGSI